MFNKKIVVFIIIITILTLIYALWYFKQKQNNQIKLVEEKIPITEDMMQYVNSPEVLKVQNQITEENRELVEEKTLLTKDIVQYIGSPKILKSQDQVIVENLIDDRVFKIYADNDNRLKKERLAEEDGIKKRDIQVKMLKPKEIYNLPKWPFYALFYNSKNLFNVSLGTSFATKAFGSLGSSEDISKLIFGEREIQIQDILLVSKLIKTGKLNAVADNGEDPANPPGRPLYAAGSQYHYYYLLADQVLKFDFSTERQEVSFNYAHHFHDNDISVGVEVPIVRRRNKIKFESKIPLSLRSDMALYRPRFFGAFENFEDFFEEILQSKGIGYNKSDIETWFGDIKFFANFEIKSQDVERSLVGIKIVLPTGYDSKRADKLWSPDLGNGGFIDLGLYFSILKKCTPKLNPHFFVDFSISLPASVNRRIPQRKIYDGVTPAPNSAVGSFLKLGGVGVTFKQNQTFSELDSVIPSFANESVKVKIQKGPQGFVRIGNIFENVFWRKANLDIFYDLRGKGRDYLCNSNLASKFDTTNLNHNTFEVEHRMGFNFSYQFNGHKRLDLGGLYTFYGHNVLKNLEGRLSFIKDF